MLGLKSLLSVESRGILLLSSLFFLFLRGAVFGPGLAEAWVHSRVPSHFCAT